MYSLSPSPRSQDNLLARNFFAWRNQVPMLHSFVLFFHHFMISIFERFVVLTGTSGQAVSCSNGSEFAQIREFDAAVAVRADTTKYA
jgi:hypothetical protein